MTRADLLMPEILDPVIPDDATDAERLALMTISRDQWRSLAVSQSLRITELVAKLVDQHMRGPAPAPTTTEE